MRNSALLFSGARRPPPPLSQGYNPPPYTSQPGYNPPLYISQSMPQSTTATVVTVSRKTPAKPPHSQPSSSRLPPSRPPPFRPSPSQPTRPAPPSRKPPEGIVNETNWLHSILVIHVGFFLATTFPTHYSFRARINQLLYSTNKAMAAKGSRGTISLCTLVSWLCLCPGFFLEMYF